MPPKRTVLRLPGVLAVCLLTVSCGSAYRGEPLHGAFVSEDPGVIAGQEAFFVHCHQCHPGGAAGLGFSINDKPLPGWLIRLQVRRGIGAMPGFSEERIPADELDALVAYLHALRRHGR